jgi:hypothetical protein
MSGMGRSGETALSSNGMEKLLLQAEHSYATTFPNNVVLGTISGFAIFSPNQSEPRLLSYSLSVSTCEHYLCK